LIRSSSLTGRPQSSCLPDCPLPSSAGSGFSAVCPTRPFRRHNGRELRWSSPKPVPALVFRTATHRRERRSRRTPSLCCVGSSPKRRPTTAFCCVGSSPKRRPTTADGASSCRGTTRRVARMQRRLPWGSTPLGEISRGLLGAPVFRAGAAPLRVPPSRSESAVASWLCFTPHPPTGFGLQGFSHPGSRASLDAVSPLPLRSAAETAALDVIEASSATRRRVGHRTFP